MTVRCFMEMYCEQFQKGLYLTDYMQYFDPKKQCAKLLESAPRSGGFHCNLCQGARHSFLKNGSCKIIQPSHSHHQTSLIAITYFQETRLPLILWFLVIYLISRAKNELTPIALSRKLDVNYPTDKRFIYKLL